MTNLFGNKYRIKSTRLPERDYRNAGAYFVTFNIKDRAELFEQIMDGEMILSDMGKICDEEIIKTGELRDNIIIDTYMVMPDHVHVIVMITDKITKPIDNISNIDSKRDDFDDDVKNLSIRDVETPRGASLRDGGLHHCIETKTIDSLQSEKRDGLSMHGIQSSPGGGPKTGNDNQSKRLKYYKNTFGPQPSGSLATIINHMKGSITRRIRKTHPDNGFARQSRYHERIIRNEKELHATRQYILDNPKKGEVTTHDDKQ